MCVRVSACLILHLIRTLSRALQAGVVALLKDPAGIFGKMELIRPEKALKGFQYVFAIGGQSLVFRCRRKEDGMEAVAKVEVC